jgi:hypothetical protein
MRNILFAFLRITGGWRRLVLRVSGYTETEVHNRDAVTGRAWSRFCDDLKAAGNVLLTPGVPRDAFNQAEGIRYLSRLTRAGLEAFLEYNDPRFPVFRRMVHETVKMGADNPDNYYLNAQVSGAYEYRIEGKRNSIGNVSFHTQNGNYGTTGGLSPCGRVENNELVVEEDGTFEIILSKTRKGKNWLKMEEDTSLVMVRQTFADRSVEVPAELRIVNLDNPGGAVPDPFGPSKLVEGLNTASMFVGGASLLFTRWAVGFKKHVNRLPQFDPGTSNAAGGDDTIVYYHSYWKLGQDEALVIDVTPPQCDNWNFQLNNFWMESLDYRYHQVCINRATAVTGPGGMVRIVVSHREPGVPNWLQTAGHTEGTMCWRWYRLHEGSRPVEPFCSVLETAGLQT